MKLDPITEYILNEQNKVNPPAYNKMIRYYKRMKFDFFESTVTSLPVIVGKRLKKTSFIDDFILFIPHNVMFEYDMQMAYKKGDKDPSIFTTPVLRMFYLYSESYGDSYDEKKYYELSSGDGDYSVFDYMKKPARKIRAGMDGIIKSMEIIPSKVKLLTAFAPGPPDQWRELRVVRYEINIMGNSNYLNKKLIVDAYSVAHDYTQYIVLQNNFKNIRFK